MSIGTNFYSPDQSGSIYVVAPSGLLTPALTSSLTASYAGTASYATAAAPGFTASYATTASYALTTAGVITNAATASYVPTPVWDSKQPPLITSSFDIEFATNRSIAAWPSPWFPGSASGFHNQSFPANGEPRWGANLTGSTWQSMYAALPAGDFCIAMRCGSYGTQTNYSVLAIGVSTSTQATTATSYEMVMGYNGTWGVYSTYAGANDSNWGSNHAIEQGIVMWMIRSGSSYQVGWSHDGGRGTTSNFRTLGFVPINLTIGGYGSNGINQLQFIDWYRYAPTGSRVVWGGYR